MKIRVTLHARQLDKGAAAPRQRRQSFPRPLSFFQEKPVGHASGETTVASVRALCPYLLSVGGVDHVVRSNIRIPALGGEKSRRLQWGGATTVGKKS
jgi:hypothetical protein